MTWWVNLNSTWQSLIVIFAALIFGIGVGGWYTVINGIPEAVTRNTSHIAEIRARMDRVEEGQKAVLDAVRLSNCLDLAQAQSQPYQQCLK